MAKKAAAQVETEIEIKQEPETTSPEAAGHLIGSLPELQKEFPGENTEKKPEEITPLQAQPTEPTKQPGKYDHLTDSEGGKFDPVVHQHKNGRPKLTKSGLLKKWVGKKRTGGPLDSRMAGGDEWVENLLHANDKFIKPEIDKKLQLEKMTQAGKAAANLLFTLGRTLGGPEWEPIVSAEHKINEPEVLEKAFADYFIATGRTDISPGWGLLVAMGGYALPRFRMPETQSKVKIAGSWFAKKWTAFQYWRQTGKSNRVAAFPTDKK